MRGDFSEVTYGYCNCGCGGKTSIALQSRTKYGWIKGEPKKFIHGHHVKHGRDNYFSKNIFRNHKQGLSGKDNPMYNVRKFGKDNPNWKGGMSILKCKNTSYVLIHMPDHPRSSRGYVLEHVLIAEKKNGGPLSDGAVVHHIDGNGLNNDENNLMVFQSNAEHLKFHKLIGK